MPPHIPTHRCPNSPARHNRIAVDEFPTTQPTVAPPWRNHGLHLHNAFGLLENPPLFRLPFRMPHSLSAVYLHIIFSTKDRRPFLTDPALRNSLHAYLGAIGKQIDCAPITINGIADHVHLLMTLCRTIPQAELIKELKRNSTTWLKQQASNLHDFQWQTGYAIFSVSQSNIPEVREYIEKQEEHHRTRTFQEELIAFLKHHYQTYDERYLWD